MDQKRLFTAIAISIAILLGFQLLLPKPPKAPSPGVQEASQQQTASTPSSEAPVPTGNPAFPGNKPIQVAPPLSAQKDAPRIKIAAPKVEGSINLAGARLDDLVLRDYHEEVSPESPLVRVLEPRTDPQPYYVQYGWTAEGGVKVPGSDDVWKASANTLTASTPVTLSWDNGAGLVFEIVVSIDDNYMFKVDQQVQNNSGAEVKLYPWARIRRDYTPQTAGYYILHEGFTGYLADRLKELGYKEAKSDGPKSPTHTAMEVDSTGGWAGITDKYWLTALVPDQAQAVAVSYRYFSEDGGDRYQVDFTPTTPLSVAPGAVGASTSRVFAGAKEVHLLDHYEDALHLPHFDKAVDFGWFYPFTKWIFYALDWLYGVTGNFGVAIMIFTVFAKALFFPLANKSYKSMSRMKELNPKIQEVRTRLKDEPQKMQAEIMQVYKTSGVNPASGCLPMVIQIPVFFSLYKVIFVTIEMRHAPFFGWIRDLSAVDPTNVFTAFGLIPWDPTQVSHFLHLGIWPLIMGCTMFFQQKLNPPPPDPVQARLFQFMPIIFTFMLANFPAGLVIYWSWNNTLTIAQQWTIMRRSKTRQAVAVRT
jgi:YidC/Oxa1 family membrane protein insertase